MLALVLFRTSAVGCKGTTHFLFWDSWQYSLSKAKASRVNLGDSRNSRGTSLACESKPTAHCNALFTGVASREQRACSNTMYAWDITSKKVDELAEVLLVVRFLRTSSPGVGANNEPGVRRPPSFTQALKTRTVGVRSR